MFDVKLISINSERELIKFAQRQRQRDVPSSCDRRGFLADWSSSMLSILAVRIRDTHYGHKDYLYEINCELATVL